MPKKVPNTDALVNELQQSVFFTSRSPLPQPSTPSTVPAKPSEPTGEKHVSVETRKHGNTDVDHAPILLSPSTPFHFDPNAKAEQKYTLAFTEKELEAMEDVKLELRRRFSIKTTKVELVRCAIGELIEDYQQHGEKSRFVARLKTRKHGNV